MGGTPQRAARRQLADRSLQQKAEARRFWGRGARAPQPSVSAGAGSVPGYGVRSVASAATSSTSTVAAATSTTIAAATAAVSAGTAAVAAVTAAAVVAAAARTIAGRGAVVGTRAVRGRGVG